MSNLKLNEWTLSEQMNSMILNFLHVNGRDVYNIAAPFSYQGETVLAGRVEARDCEDAEINLFRQTATGWEPFFKSLDFVGLQDPCVTMIGGRVLLGGVRFPCVFEDGTEGWQMDFYLESENGAFELVFSGPKKMKDIRMLELSDGRILVLTRPQGSKGGAGRIGYVVVNSLADVTVEAINGAPLIDGLCEAHEWVGANEAHMLANGTVGVLGHVACFGAGGQRHYYAMAFVLDPATGQTSATEIIARRSDFPDGPAKRPDLKDVLFSGGLIRMADGRARLYVGLSDTQAGSVDIKDPFTAHEQYTQIT